MIFSIEIFRYRNFYVVIIISTFINSIRGGYIRDCFIVNGRHALQIPSYSKRLLYLV